MVQNANDPPWVSTYPQTIRYEDYPPYVAPNGSMSLRVQQSVHLLADSPKLSRRFSDPKPMYRSVLRS